MPTGLNSWWAVTHRHHSVMGHVHRFALASFTDKFKQPSRVSPAIAAANAHLKGFAETQDRATYVDCSPVLLEKVFLQFLLKCVCVAACWWHSSC